MDADNNRKLLLEEYESTQKLAERMRFSFLGYQIENISQRREFYKHITLISSAVLALSPVIISNTLSKSYAYIGIIIYFFLTILIFTHIREALDIDANGFEESIKKYSEISSEKIDIINGFLSSKSIDDNKLREYLSRLVSSKGAATLKEDIKKSDIEAETRKSNPNYFGELIIFLFTSASFFILISFFPIPLATIVGAIAFIFGIIFSPLAATVEKWISKPAHFLCKPRTLHNKRSDR